ncbi:hypothetical protein [Planctopirus hydrillae]|uniref:Uncharacterized protein n=1 Tax=Planctopirus hydrillae TaxID=1841610 RepID=A0A1C3E9X7_9PLAN|nr:hypothetical protein [Planctopirus hydrillae]ODA30020.1 hypothetical protein A6X21_06690 [Planctopirus hydrillae]
MRNIFLHAGSPSAAPLLIDQRLVSNCWFEWLRQGGCGPGELECNLPLDSPLFAPGDFVSIEDQLGTRWYLGRIEEHLTRWPNRAIIRLEGLAIELGEVFPGGFANNEIDTPDPYRLGLTEGGFSFDPDYGNESFAFASRPEDVVRKLLELEEIAGTQIAFPPEEITHTATPVPLESFKFHGEESLRSIFKDLALRAGNAPWGVDEMGRFFFRAGQEFTTQAIPRTSIIQLEHSRSLDQIFNRVLLTGAYLYLANGQPYRWRGNYTEPTSRALYGERRIRLWVPWIRTAQDARGFLKEFFSQYAFPTGRLLVESVASSPWLPPWKARYQLEGFPASTGATWQADKLRIEFNETPVYRLELGPVDPRTLWPEPDHDERWPLAPTSELPSGFGGEEIPLPWPPGGGGGGGHSSSNDSLTSDELSSSIILSSSEASSILDHSSDSSSWLTTDSSDHPTFTSGDYSQSSSATSSTESSASWHSSSLWSSSLMSSSESLEDSSSNSASFSSDTLANTSLSSDLNSHETTSSTDSAATPTSFELPTDEPTSTLSSPTESPTSFEPPHSFDSTETAPLSLSSDDSESPVTSSSASTPSESLELPASVPDEDLP